MKNLQSLFNLSQNSIQKKFLDELKGQYNYSSACLMKKVIKEMIDNTKNNKILWQSNNKGFSKGIVTSDSPFSGYKIMIERWNERDIDGYKIARMNNNGQIFKINLINNSETAKNIEYTSNILNNEKDVSELFELINCKSRQIYN